MTNRKCAVADTRPYTEAHAVVWVDIAIIFERKLSSKQLRRLGAVFNKALPELGLVASDADGHGDGRRFVFSKKGEDGSVTETLHIHDNFVHVLQSEYRGWTVTRDAAIERLTPLIALLPDAELPAGCLGMAFRDAFLQDEPKKYDIVDVFKPNIYLPRFVFDAGRLWDIRLEWRESDVPKPWEGAVSRLSVDAEVRGASPKVADGKKSEQFLHVSEITHRQQVMVRKLKEKPQLSWSVDMVRDWLDYLHDRNKALINELLTDAMLERIGLKE